MENKRRLTDYETVALTEECLSKNPNMFRTKLKCLGSFKIHQFRAKHLYARIMLSRR